MEPGLAQRIKTWMFAEALPFWSTEGLDVRHGGVVESFALDGRSLSGVTFKRTRVACRQLYVFSHAEILGWSQARKASDHTYAHLVDKFWLGPDKGWARRVTTEGALLDSTPDLYDYAFALFALGWRHKATRDPQALKLAHATLDFVEANFRHANGLGYHAVLPGAPPREQNPHMHLAEAAIVLAETSGDARFIELAGSVTDLFVNRIVRRTGVLPEFFEDDWSPVHGESGRAVEPGHQFEWAWILARLKTVGGKDHGDIVGALVDWAEKYGVDPATQVTFNKVRDDGVPLDKGSRTWPNTERIKGWIGHAELNGADPWRPIEGSARLLLDRYLGQAPRACWLDTFDASGRPNAEVIPTSTLYHVFLAFAEILRIDEVRASA